VARAKLYVACVICSLCIAYFMQGKRLHHLSCTMVQIDYLYAELGIVPPSPDDIPSTSTGSLLSRPSSSSGMLSASSDLDDPFLCASVRASTPTPASRGKSSLLFNAEAASPNAPELEYQRVFSNFVARLEELGDELVQDPAKPSVGLEGVDPSPGLISWAERTRVELEDLKRKRESHIQTIYDQLETLWKRMSVSEAEMDAFVERNMGSNEEVVRAYEEELDRMLELKRERMSTFVENARAEITKLWDDLMVGEAERADFAPMADGECLSLRSTNLCAETIFFCRRTYRRLVVDTRGRDSTVERGATVERHTPDKYQEIPRYLSRGERPCCCRFRSDASPWAWSSRSRKTLARREDAQTRYKGETTSTC
jgi:hypothetical protein